MALTQRWTTVPLLAAYLGVHPRTVWRWVRSGVLPAAQVQTRHYADERVRKTRRGAWRIHERDVVRLLTEMRAGGRAPDGLWRP
jgi:excisionase family DNA binding protein